MMGDRGGERKNEKGIFVWVFFHLAFKAAMLCCTVLYSLSLVLHAVGIVCSIVIFVPSSFILAWS